jgi:hypothetical protein
MKKPRKMLIIICMLAVSLLAVSCQQPLGSETVLLQGAVTIGPISPVEKPGECSPVSPEVFAARKLMIYDESGKHLVREVYFTQIDNGATGYYTAQLAPGTYVIDINHSGMDTADNLPQTITVVADETITIDVNIDTGIR